MDYVRKKQFIVDVLYVAIILILGYCFLKYGFALISPFILAYLIAFVLKKPARYFSKKLKMPIKLTSVIMAIVFYGTIGLFIALIGIKIFTELSTFISNLPNNYRTNIEPFLMEAFDNIGNVLFTMDPTLVEAMDGFFTQFTSALGEMITGLSVKAVSAISNGAVHLPSFFVKIFLMIISTFFISADYEKISKFIVTQVPNKWMKLFLQIKQYIIGTLLMYIKSYAMIMSITFIELSLGLTILGVKDSIIIALIIALFDVLPVLGTGGIMIPWIIIMALQNEYTMAVGLLVVYLLVTVVRNIMEPKIVGGHIGLHPLVILISIFVGAKLFGVAGFFGFPIMLSIIKSLNDAGTIRLFR